jgi:hypothetical protein
MVLVAAALIGLLVPPAAFFLLHDAYPLTWLAELKNVQTLAGALVALFAASLATTPLVITARYYDNNPGNVGVFPSPLPEKLAAFYLNFESIRIGLEDYSANALRAFPRVDRANASNVVADSSILSKAKLTLNWTVETIPKVTELGQAVIKELEKIRDAKFG